VSRSRLGAIHRRAAWAGVPLVGATTSYRRRPRPAVARHAIRTRRRRGVVTVAVVAGAALLAALAFVGIQLVGSTPCVPVRVVATPEMAPVVEQAARRIATPGCTSIAVTARASAVQAASLGVADGEEPPHVWLPESSVLLARARALGAAGIPETGTSVASSPVVMGLTEDAVARLGDRAAVPGWSDVLGSAAVKVGIPDPTRDPVGLAALLEADAAGRGSPDPAKALAGTIVAVARDATVEAADLYDRLPGTPGTDKPVTAFPTSEQALLRYNVTHPDTALTAAYPALPTSALDFPFTVLTIAGPDEQQVAGRLLESLQSTQGQSSLADAGFRGPGGEMLRDRSQDGRTRPTVPAPVPLLGAPRSAELLQLWATVTRTTRVQVLIDVSGSMNAVVPELGKSRIAATLDAAEGGMGLFEPTSRLSCWVFATELDGALDYREVVPSTAVSDLLRDDNLAKLRSIRATKDGNTGLYDSLLAVYGKARRDYDPGRQNVVVVMTDGNNEDPGGISREELEARLAPLRDPQRPVIIVGVLIGTDVDPAEMRSIARPTGGDAYLVADPSRITGVYLSLVQKLHGAA
jgi:hypothetical protein